MIIRGHHGAYQQSQQESNRDTSSVEFALDAIGILVDLKIYHHFEKHTNPMFVRDEHFLARCTNSQAARGLHYVHSLNVCHGDIKPSNILENAAGQASF